MLMHVKNLYSIKQEVNVSVTYGNLPDDWTVKYNLMLQNISPLH